MMRLSLRSMVAFTALGLVGALSGGSAAADPATPIPGMATPTPGPDVQAPTPHGFVQIIGEAISEVTLRPDQETAVEALSKQIEPLQIKVDNAENGLLLTLADQVQAGRIDRDALAPRITDYVNARLAVRDELREAVEKLHDLLDSGQREDFADAVEDRVYRVRMALLSGEQLDALAQRLNLDDSQKGKISEGLQQIAPALEHERVAIHRAIEGFRGDTFSVESYLPASQLPEKARARAERLVDLTETITDMLDSEQRNKLAARIREAAAARGDEPADNPTTPADPQEEHVGTAAQHLWVGGVRRGPWGGVRGGVVVAGAPGYFFRRARAFPYAAGFGVGW
jgi:hypothetical protein